jgi:hypothetical protein
VALPSSNNTATTANGTRARSPTDTRRLTATTSVP